MMKRLLLILLPLVIFISGCGKKKNYTVLEERKNTPVKFTDLTIRPDYRMGREVGINLSGLAKGLVNQEGKGFILLQVYDQSGARLMKKILPEHEVFGSGPESRIGKNDQRTRIGGELDLPGEQITSGEDTSEEAEEESETEENPVADSSTPPAEIRFQWSDLQPQSLPYQELFFPDSTFMSDFFLFLPYQELNLPPGASDLQFSLTAFPNSSSPISAANEDGMESAKALAYLKVAFKSEIPKLEAMRIGVTRLTLNSDDMDVSEFDFSLNLGNRERAGYPDIFWTVNVGDWEAWASPRYRNSLSGTWFYPSDVIWLHEGEKAKICVYDYDFPSRDDVVSCTEINPAELPEGKENPYALSAEHIREMLIYRTGIELPDLEFERDGEITE